MILIYSTKLTGFEFVASFATILFTLALVNSFAEKEHLGLDFAWCWAAVQGSQTRATDNLSPRKSSLIFWSWQVVSCRCTYSHLQTVRMRTDWCTYPCGCFLTRRRWCVLKESVSLRFFSFLTCGLLHACTLQSRAFGAWTDQPSVVACFSEPRLSALRHSFIKWQRILTCTRDMFLWILH